jgi:hypothetical protein
MNDRDAASRLFRNARREAVTAVVVWVLALTWTVGYCYLFGYQHDPQSWLVQQGWVTPRTKENLQHFGGIPDWVFIGILVPWLLCSAFTIGFCLGMKDDDLGQEAADPMERHEGAGHGH